MTAAMIIQEVAPRDGLQIEPVWVPTEDKVKLIDALSTMGFTRIEVTSFVSARAVPALRDADEVFRSIARLPGVTYVALVPNLRGAERAIDAGADELNMVLSASETHNLANMRMTLAASFAAFEDVCRIAADSAATLNGTVATAFGCPFEGEQTTAHVLGLVRRYLDLGVDRITLADTTGMANPYQVSALVTQVVELVSPDALTLHFHNTRGLGLANVLAAFSAGARRFDAALGGLGGCPFAPGASGNICTEDLAAMCEEMDIPTNIDVPGLIKLARTLPVLLGHDVPGQVMKAGRARDLHPVAPIPGCGRA